MKRSYDELTYSFLKVIGVGFCIGWKAKLMHHPISFGAFASTSTVIDQWLLQANAFMGFFHAIYGLVNPCGLPEPWPSYPVWPHAVSVLPPSYAEKIPLFVPKRIHLFMHYHKKEKLINIFRNNELTIYIYLPWKFKVWYISYKRSWINHYMHFHLA